ncbi:cobyrinic acid a,c-diamide synthase [Acetobacter aceti 1023]|nr:cobyrinic acid a,c-diamide synthase [Acetobacter aceti 1023]
MIAPRIIMVAAPRSGGGKTTITLALLAAFQRRGLRVGAVKTGPDYIDPAFHAAITHRPPLNVDSWCMPVSLLSGIMNAAATDVDVVVVESAMGLFDGLMAPEGARGAPADIAALFGVPVLLVLDVSGQGQSVGPIAQGFARWSETVQVRGVVLNRVASQRHERLARSAVEIAGLPVCGALMRQKGEVLPERHLGLVQAREHGNLAGWLSDLADKAERELNLDAILQIASPLVEAKVNSASLAAACIPPPGQRIAVADDAAFSFLYGHLSLFWRQAGAELVPFSPLADQAPDASCDACWLSGGYPELYASQIAQAEHFKKGLKDFALTHPVHGECGGYMVLGKALEDAQGQMHTMAGLLGHVTSFAHRKLHLGYREATLLADNILGRAGTRLRGHEFHYATVTDKGSDTPLADLIAGDGALLDACGGQRGLVSGSFFHVLAQSSNQNILNSSAF